MSLKTVEDLYGEALDAIKTSGEAHIPLRLLGGLAIRARCPSFSREPFRRVCGDMDFAVDAPPSALEKHLDERGWTADREFNVYNGGSRLIYRSPGGAKADFFVGGFSMCHKVSFKDRLLPGETTLPLAELLITKLQVVEANEKDLSDAACILADHDFAEKDGEAINALRIAALCSRDWGLYRTLQLSLGKLAVWATQGKLEPALRTTIEGRLAAFEAILESSPKGPAWKLRAAIGDRLPWYETPEESER